MGYKSLGMAAVFVLAVGSLTTAGAADMATGEQIGAAVSGNTIRGSMLADRYAEFYQGDATIKGDGYAGEWKIDGDAMCFSYSGELAGCWQARIEGPAIIWYRDGAVDGTGTIVPGNPNEF